MLPLLLLSPKAKTVLSGALVVLVVIVGLYFHNELGVWTWDAFKRDDIALTLAPNNLELTAAVAAYYFNGGAYDLNKAETHYEKLLDAGYDDKSSRYQLARIYFVQGRLYKAEKLLTDNLEKYPTWDQTRYMLGLTYIYQGKFKEAVEQFEKFLAYRSDTFASYNDLAWAYIKNKQYDEAINIAQDGLEKWPDNLWLHNIAGVALWNAGELREAESHFVKAKERAATTGEEEWGRAYPGNDPATYGASLEAMKNAIEENLRGVEQELRLLAL